MLLAILKKMNNRIVIYLLIFACVLTSCQDEIPEPRNNPKEAFHYKNPPLPQNVEELRILAIGNSFTDDAIAYMYTIVDKGGVDANRYCLYKIAHPSASLDHFVDLSNSKKFVTAELCAGHIAMEDKGTLGDIVAQDWDVIVIQQASDLSDKWESYKNMGKYIDFLCHTCTNDRVCLMLQLPWSHTKEEMPDVLNNNISCTLLASQCFGIDIIIPTGTAIQLARNTELNDDMYLTHDNWHLNQGIGRYIANCVWYQKLFITTLGGRDIVGNESRPTIGKDNSHQLELAQKCAKQAVISPWDYNAHVE